MNKNNWYIKGSAEFTEFVKKYNKKHNIRNFCYGNSFNLCYYLNYLTKVITYDDCSNGKELITIEELNKMYFPEDFPVLFTIQDLAQGKCALEFNRAVDNVEYLRKVLKKAFAEDDTHPEGLYRFYFKNKDSWYKWHLDDETNLPTQKLSEFLKELNMETKEIVAYKLLKDLPDLETGYLFVKNERNEWDSDLNTENGYAYTNEEIIKLTEWFEPQYKPEFKIGDWVITTTKISSSFCKPEKDEVFQITNINNYNAFYNSVDGVGKERIRLATQEEVRNFKQSQEIKLGDYVVEFKSGGIKVHNQHYPKTYLEQVKDILSTNYVHSIKFGCTGEYTLTLNDVIKILERINQQYLYELL